MDDSRTCPTGDDSKDALMRRIRLPLPLMLVIVGCATPYERAMTRNAEVIRSVRQQSVARASNDGAIPPPADQPLAASDVVVETRTSTAEPVPDVRTVAFDDVADADASLAETESDVPTLEADTVESGPNVSTGEQSEYPVDLGTILALVAGENPQVQFAQWRIREAHARLDGAEALWLPSIQVGFNYHRHDGTYQASNGAIVDVNRSSFQAGLGAGAVGAGTILNPGIVSRFHTTDAVFAPRIAERTAWARSHAAKATLHDRLLDAALAYLTMLDASQQQAISNDTLANTLDLAELTESFAVIGQGLQADADRMAAELAVRRNDLIRAEEAMAVASVRLAEVVSFDLAATLVPVEPTVVPVELVQVGADRHGLVAVGLSNRPELREARCLVAEACERLEREKYAPLLPSVLLGFSYSGFGGGLGDHVGSVHDRADFDALAVWEVRNLGVGERAARDTVRTQVEQRRWNQIRLMDQVAREVAEAAAQVEARQRQIDVSEQAIEIARLSYERNLRRIRDGQGLPIEALQSLQALDVAQREYLRAVVGYNEAQFQLHRALGWPIAG